MCGICGVVSFWPDGNAGLDILRRMNHTLRHRGPDDEGYYQDHQAALAMRRLSVIDLKTGHQPIANETGTVWVVYNGEIYNFLQVRKELESRGHVFRTQTDTEIIVHAYEEYGDDCVSHFNGMFAFALWDAQKARLLLARDRLGIKPLFYWTDHSRLVFGSELKAVTAHPSVPRSVDLTALDLFLTLEYIPAPRTIYQGIQKLPPGHILVLSQGKISIRQYWDVTPDTVTLTEAECTEALAEMIQESVRLRMISDVPLGVFLSGGMDSSTIAAYMSRAASAPVQTFSIGFEDSSYNELPYARAVAEHIGAQHHEEVLNPDIRDLVERLVGHMDEPFADTSIFPTFLVSEMARRHVTVVLSGDGGDELFAGYDTYLAENLDRRYYSKLPAAIRRRLLPKIADWLPPQPAKKGTINKIKRMIEGGAIDGSLQHARWMIFLNPAMKAALYQPDLQAVQHTDPTANLFAGYFARASQFDPLAQQQYVDIKTYLADDILAKVDRMSMAVSLEARVPLLDYRIVEFALNLPPRMKLNGARTKIILRNAVKGVVPDIVLNKPKQGFSIPMKHWLGDTLKPMMLDLLSEEGLRKSGYFAPQVVSQWIREHLEGRVNHSHRLWPLMVFALWQCNEASFAQE